MSDLFKDSDVDFNLRKNSKPLKVKKSRKPKRYIGRSLLSYALLALFAFNIHLVPYEASALGYRIANTNVERENPKLDYLYDEYITGIANMIKEMGYDNDPIKAFSAFLNLNLSGNLSIGNEFKIEDPYYETYDREGISVLLGSGVCRNQSELFYEVMKKLGFDVNINTGKVSSGDLNGMHVVVSVYYNDTLVLMDPTNYCFFLNDGTGKYKSVSAYESDNEYYFEMSKAEDLLFAMNDKIDNSRYNRKVNDYDFFAKSLRDEFVAFFIKVGDLDINYQDLEEKYLGDVEKELTTYILENFSLTEEEVENINSKNILTRLPILFKYLWNEDFFSLDNQISDTNYISSDEEVELSKKIG